VTNLDLSRLDGKRVESSKLSRYHGGGIFCMIIVFEDGTEICVQHSANGMIVDFYEKAQEAERFK
jgi:hypothetical protein